MKRIFYFLLTNIAFMVMFSIIFFVLSLFGINFNSQGSIPQMLAFAMFVGFLGSFVSLLLSKWSAKRLMGIELIDETSSDNRAKRVYQLTKQIVAKTNLKMPEVGIYHSADMNAFATGAFKNSSLIAVSTALIDKMNNDELEGVIAHEVAHIQNGDMVTLTLIQGVVNTFVVFASNLIVKAIKSSNENLGVIAEMVTLIALQLILGFLAIPIVAFFSRTREYRADEGSAKLTSKEKMIAALERLKKEMELDSEDMPKELLAFGIKGKESLFSTHPAIEKRIKNLQDM